MKKFEHVRFFDSQEQLYSTIMETVQKNNYVFLSGDKNRNTPLWHTTVNGLIKKIDLDSKQLSLLVDEEDEHVVKTVKIKTTVTENRNIKLSYQHGIRIDQEKVYTKQKGVVDKFKLAIHPSARSSIIEDVSSSPAENFLKEVQPGDYVTIWSGPDKIQKDFLHYPVQGWLWSKSEERKEVSYIHPPRMDIQTFQLKDDLTAFGFYRKLVLQLSKF